MDDQQARKVNEAAEKFAQSLTEAYQALADRSVSAQELNAHLTQSFFNRVIENLGTQAESNRTLAGNLIEQQRKQQEASQADATQDDATHHPIRSWMQTTETATSPPGEEQTPEEEPPKEDRSERRGSVPTAPPTAREDPPGEERPSRRTL